MLNVTIDSLPLAALKRPICPSFSVQANGTLKKLQSMFLAFFLKRSALDLQLVSSFSL
jgi:hypothetical protein